jgi:predicted ATP-dependent serine protease
LVVLTLEELLKKEIPPRKNLLTPWLPSQGLCMIYSKRGLGKTWLALEIAYAVSSGGRFLNWEAEYPQGVLYIDGEMPLSLMQERLSEIEKRKGQKIGKLFKILSPDAQKFGIPDLSTREGQEKIDELIGDEIKLVVLDNLSTLIRSGKESESDSWLPVQEWGLRLRSRGKSVLLIHHAGKGGQQRGTSRREDVLDTVIALREPENYSPDSGTCFEVHFEKNRSLYGDEIKSFEAHLETHLSNDGVETINWEYKSLDDSTFDKVCRLSIDGLSNTEITQELGIHKSTVSRHIYRGKEEGKISQQSD